MDWSAVDYCDVYILTAPIHGRGSIAETFLQTCSYHGFISHSSVFLSILELTNSLLLS